MTDQNTTKTVESITLTPAAVIEVKRLIALEKEESLYLRLGVAAGGCSGMSYSMSFDTERTEADLAIDYDGFTVVMEPKSLPHMAGSVLDYQGGMLGGGFVFSNPNAKRTCGCGTSFTC